MTNINAIISRKGRNGLKISSFVTLGVRMWNFVNIDHVKRVITCKYYTSYDLVYCVLTFVLFAELWRLNISNFIHASTYLYQIFISPYYSMEL